MFSTAFVEAIENIFSGEQRLRDIPLEVAILDRQMCQIGDDVNGARLTQRVRNRALYFAKRGFVEVALTPETDEHHAVGKGASHVMQYQRGADLAVHVGAPTPGSDRAR